MAQLPSRRKRATIAGIDTNPYAPPAQTEAPPKRDVLSPAARVAGLAAGVMFAIVATDKAVGAWHRLPDVWAMKGDQGGWVRMFGSIAAVLSIGLYGTVAISLMRGSARLRSLAAILAVLAFVGYLLTMKTRVDHNLIALAVTPLFTISLLVLLPGRPDPTRARVGVGLAAVWLVVFVVNYIRQG